MRLPRLDFLGIRHYVIDRGARRQDVFVDVDSLAVFCLFVTRYRTLPAGLISTQRGAAR